MWTLASCLALTGVAAAWLGLFSSDAAHANEVEGVTLQLPGLGALRGSLNTSAWTKRTIYQFQGIPFGKPPVGHLRFKVKIICLFIYFKKVPKSRKVAGLRPDEVKF
jgi:hypothetical protein